ncbi:hypothetical protein L596_011615 [Steinernema carpocapsae]|uniref:Uncharacterized protein n=1 Tax=Steinernema carpocapsae TaxID=34508 RepID=A0A4U5NUJ6_STECR|nr:hypothetical protein L596_011615 [Steinernema carpocapsae]
MGSGGSTPSNAGGKSSVAPAKGGGGAKPAAAGAADDGEAQKVDHRLPFANFRELYTMKNYWKAVKRANESELGRNIMVKYFTENPSNVELYPKLKGIDPKTIGSTDSVQLENVAKLYVQVFDDVISSVEANPSNADAACKRLQAVGKLHRVKVSGMDSTKFQALEQPFLYMVSEVLQDRFNDKAEQLFKKFFQFCLQYLTEGFNG